MELKKYIGHNIKYLRKSDGLTQREFAHILGYKTYTIIVKWESGKALPPLDTLIRISEFFDVSIDDLVYSDLEAFSPINKSRERKGTIWQLEDAIVEAFAHASREAQRIILDILHIDHKPFM